MILKSIKLVAVELTMPFKIFIDTSREYGNWEIEPEFSIVYIDANEYFLNIETTLRRTLDIQHATLTVMTSFKLELGDNQYIPTNDANFLEMASCQQIAFAHARAFFISESKGSKFAGELLPIDSFFAAFEKVKLIPFGENRQN